MIDYDDLRKKAEATKSRQEREIQKVIDYYDAVRPTITLRLLDIIAVAKTGLEGEVCNNPTCHHDECVWSRGVLNEIAKLEKE